MKYSICAALFFLCGCATLIPSKPLDPKIFYKPDIVIESYGTDGFEKTFHKGWGVIGPDDKMEYKMKITSPGDIDLVKISTCARADVSEPNNGRIFRNDKVYNYTFVPDEKLELGGNCFLMIETYEAGSPGRHATGIFEIDGHQHTTEKEPASVTCDARTTNYSGVSMCVTMDGKWQRIKFQTDAILNQDANDPKCKISEPEDASDWIFKTPNRECIYLFKVGKGFHRHMSVGWEQAPVRKLK